MGLAGYYRWFIEGFSKITFPSTSLQRKGKIIKWTKECQDSFEKLKLLLTTTSVLRVDDPNKEFEVCIDACKEGFGVILSEEGKVVSYESHKIKDHG